uniref:WGS project CAEQ00000000 data, annotated contig 1891 n=1 Tax=Trypanosoma congolense (strain IL3000) TaxID=1068625 RepID=F9W9S5_TRYCI|nr:unnamed protein product [Trypanosoma congolense IL3000]
MSQLHSRFSCVIFSLDWDSLRDVSLDVIKALDVWNSLLEYSRSVRSKVIVALATEEEETSVADFQEKQTSLLQVLKALLGEEFNALVPLFKLGMEKKSADILLQMLERLSREYHTSELTRLKNKTKKSREHELRCMFKAGRHCLVVRDLKTATECLEDAYDCLRSIVSSRAPMELRMCGTIIVIHILNAAKAAYSVATGDKYYNICENHMTLLEEPLSECESNTLAQFLRLLLIDELHFWLAKNTSCMTRSICASHLCASMAALEGALRLSRPIEKSEERLAAPPMIGVECCLDSHQCIYFLKETAVFLSERARGLLSDAASLTNPSAEVLYASMRLNVMLGRADAALQLLGKLWEQGVKSYDCTKSVHGLLMELTDSAAGDVVQKCSREVAFAFASLCFGPGSSEQQNSFRDLFVSAASRYPSDLLLSYPHKGYYAPFTVLCVFTHVHDNSSSHKMELTFCTHSIDTIALDSISVGLSRLCKGKVDGWGLQSSMNGPVELCSRNANTVSFLFCLEDPGVYFCSAVSARVRIGAICLNVEWRFDEIEIELYIFSIFHV